MNPETPRGFADLHQRAFWPGQFRLILRARLSHNLVHFVNIVEMVEFVDLTQMRFHGTSLVSAPSGG